MSYQFDGEFIEKFYLTFTMLAYESNRRFYPVGEVVGPMDKYKFTRNEVDMLFFLNSCVDKKVKPQHDFKDIDMNILNQYIPPRVSMATTCRSVEKLVQNGLAERYYLNNNRKCEFTIELRQNISQFNNRLLLTNIFSVKYNFFIGNPMKFFLQTLFHI